MKLDGRKVAFFRAHIDPGVGPTPKNAIHAENMKLKACEITPAGIYVMLPDGQEHIVPYANVQSIKLVSETPNVKEKLSS